MCALSARPSAAVVLLLLLRPISKFEVVDMGRNETPGVWGFTAGFPACGLSRPVCSSTAHILIQPQLTLYIWTR